MDWDSLTLANPTLLWLAPGALIVAALAAAAGARHELRTRLVALGLRGMGVCALCVLIAGPQYVQSEETRFEPKGAWRLLMQEAPMVAGTRDFRDPPELFVARVRNALAAGNPPARCEVFGQGQHARWACDALLALDMPCVLTQPAVASSKAAPMLLGFDAPRELQPGEPLSFALRLWGDAEPAVTIDGQAVQFTREAERVNVELPALEPGRHVIEATLPSGQRVGHVLRVGPKPRLLMVGLDDAQAASATRLVPDFEHDRCTPEDFTAEGIAGTQVILATVQSLYRLRSLQAFALSAFVGRGGGLYVTGDGAKFVPPEYLADDIKRLLPVKLLPEPKPEDPPEPPVKEEPTIEEIAKVSVCYVLDRSNSMNANIGNYQETRWQVAIKGVLESMAKLSIDARASVMTFTLTQNWLYKPRVFFEHDRDNVLAAQLRKAQSDNEYDEAFYNTDIYAAVKAAIDVMKDEPSAVKMIIMLTDGADRPANASAGLKHTDLRDLAVSKGINIVSIGIGEAFGGELGAEGAQNVIRDLATSPEFVFMAANAEDARKAHTIFVNSVSTAFKMFDDKKAREEAERKRKLEDLANKQQEPPKIDALKGVFPLRLEPLGKSLFGADALGDKPPRIQWYARNEPRPGAAVGLSIDAEGAPAALAFAAYGLGRTAFWAAGTQPDSLGEVAGWADFPGLFAATVRWLAPREVPDLRLIGGATPDGIELLDPVDGASYLARDIRGNAITLTLDENMLRAQLPLPEGAYQVFEQSGGSVREIGDAYVAARPQGAQRFEPAFAQPPRAQDLQPLPPVSIARRTSAELPAMLLLALFLGLLPMERLVRRRS